VAFLAAWLELRLKPRFFLWVIIFNFGYFFWSSLAKGRLLSVEASSARIISLASGELSITFSKYFFKSFKPFQLVTITEIFIDWLNLEI